MLIWWKAASAAFILAIVTFAVIYLLPGVDATLGHFVVLLVIPGVYIGMAIAEGNRRKILIESVVAFAFVAIAVAGFRYSPIVIGIGLLLHGIWDFLHHYGWLQLKTGRFYPPFCAAYDFLVGTVFIAYQCFRLS